MIRRRNEERGGERTGHSSPHKRLKTNSSTTAVTGGEERRSDATNGEETRPKSKKELRAEKKAAKKVIDNANDEPVTAPSNEEQKVETIRLKKERRKVFLKERERIMQKEHQKEKKLHKQKKRNWELNHSAGGGVNAAQAKREKAEPSAEVQKSATAAATNETQEQDMSVFNDVFNGSNDDATGATTLRMGVKYIDVGVGSGPVIQDRTLVTVRYKLTAGRFGSVIDSSKKFNFRLGKGEVIQGWDIGLQGMREGGRRQLIVPPKAGYGGQDIGAGPGAILFFDITLLSCRA